MAEIARKLPKWQAAANPVPNCSQQISCQTKIFIGENFINHFPISFF
jgi:hypothetical protein